MSLKKLFFLGRSVLLVLIASSYYSCKKQEPEKTLFTKPSIDFYFDLGFGKDTTVKFSDTESYRFFFQNSTGESRCADLDCSSCPYQVGTTGVKLKVYNSNNDSISLQPSVFGCRLEEADSAINMLNLRNLNSNFNVAIGIKKILPYPVNYANNSIHFEEYVATFRIIKK
jgi:hypothetical protein